LSRRPRAAVAWGGALLWTLLGAGLARAAAPGAAPATPAAAGAAAVDPAGGDGDEEPPALADTGAGPAVGSIEVRSDAPLPARPDVASLLDVAVGEPLTDLRVRRTLRNVYASGLASEVEVYVRPAEPSATGASGAAGGPAPGVVAIVVLRAAVQVDAVRIVGDLGLPLDDLENAIEQRADQPLEEDRVVRGVYALQDRYRANGYFRAQVRVAVSTDPVRQRATVVYHVAAGPRATIASVAFDGSIAPFDPATLTAQLRTKPGAPYRQGVVRDDSDRLERWLIRQGHNLARVDRAREPIDAAKNQVAVTFPVRVGPKLVVDVIGAAKDTLRRKDLLPFLGDEGYDEALVIQAVAKIKDYLQEQGHYHARVDSAEHREDGILRLTITTQPGPAYTLKEVRFTGDRGVSASQLASLMSTSERRLLALGSGRLVDSELAKDLDNVRSYYALQGYPEAKVGPPQIDERGRDLTLTIPIVEGRRELVGNLTFAGVEALDWSQVQPLLPLAPGGPFNPYLLDTLLDILRAAFADRGYDQAQVSAATAWNPEHTRVDIKVSAIAGPQAVVDRVIVRGNRKTRTEVIRRFAGVERGQPISTRRLLEIERKLYALGIFSSVKVDLTRAGLGATGRDVVIRVEEGKDRSLTYGVGYDTQDGPRGLLGFSSSNVAGEGYRFTSDLRLAARNKRIRVLFDQPNVGRYQIPLTSSLFYIQDTEPSNSFEVRRWGAREEAVRQLGRTRFSLAFDYRVVRLRVKAGVALNDIERKNLPYQLASVVPSLFLDHRDDPIFATRGWSTLVQTQYSFPALGSDANFVKALLQQSQYFRLGRPGVLALSARVGGIEAFRRLGTGDPNTPQDLPSSNVFIDERFFAGGATTHRAYALDLLGIRGQSLILPPGGGHYQPIGGNGLLLFNLDYRFPIAGAFGGVVFVDSGNVWADWRNIRLDDLKTGAGLGARWNSPIGPLTVTIGWKLRRDAGESASPVVFLNFGNPF
jgi:outer membrane protein insertion porin family